MEMRRDQRQRQAAINQPPMLLLLLLQLSCNKACIFIRRTVVAALRASERY